MASGESNRRRGAASSMARGKPSRREQIATIAATLAFVTAKSGLMARARSTNIAMASNWAAAAAVSDRSGSGTANGATGYSCSERSCKGLRL